MTDEIWRWDATRMAGAIARREISSREAVSSCLERMAAVNPRLNAVTVDLGPPLAPPLIAPTLPWHAAMSSARCTACR